MYCEINIVWFAFKHDVRRNRDRKGRVSIRSRRVVRSASQVYIVLSIRQYMSRRCPSGHWFSCGHSPRCWCWAVAIYSSESLTYYLLRLNLCSLHFTETRRPLCYLDRLLCRRPFRRPHYALHSICPFVCLSVPCLHITPAWKALQRAFFAQVFRSQINIMKTHNIETIIFLWKTIWTSNTVKLWSTRSSHIPHTFHISKQKVKDQGYKVNFTT